MNKLKFIRWFISLFECLWFRDTSKFVGILTFEWLKILWSKRNIFHYLFHYIFIGKHHTHLGWLNSDTYVVLSLSLYVCVYQKLLLRTVKNIIKFLVRSTPERKLISAKLEQLVVGDNLKSQSIYEKWVNQRFQ